MENIKLTVEDVINYTAANAKLDGYALGMLAAVEFAKSELTKQYIKKEKKDATI